jgi:tetratricopeptide (TPR) repeat protein
VRRCIRAICAASSGAALLLLLGADATADPTEALSRIEQRWGEIRWQLADARRLEACRALAAEAGRVRQQHPDSAKAWIWEAIALAGYAEARSDMGALGPLRAARNAYEHSIGLGAHELVGFAYANLGTLYHRVPGWPISYGSDDRARELLRRGIDADPESLDTHYAYGRFLIDEGEYAAGIEALERALAASPGPIHARHHDARLQDVRADLERARLALRSQTAGTAGR